ncbi:MAG: 6-phosphofructokinase [Candidatus Omnitrophica bacterium]|nr:6-phosphofructokinase [Candidatus Omnitrophota bacterium]
MKKIGILTGGADCPGLNAVIRAVVYKGMQEGYVITGIKNGWQGLIDNDTRVLDTRAVSGILDRGGTILGTSRLDPLVNPEHVEKIAENYKRNGMDALIAVGGEVTLGIASELHKKGIIKVVGIPKSIDNALSGTDYAFGFDTAVQVATELIDRLHTTAEANHRIMVIEVMGQFTGWIAVEAGVAGGADIIIVPEFKTDIMKVCEAIKNRHRRGKSFSIVVVSEGAQVEMPGVYQEGPEKRRFGSIGERLAKAIEDNTGYETRVSLLGYIQRGGAPTAFDRILATRFGVKSVELVVQGKFGKMVSYQNNRIKYCDIEEAVTQRKKVDADLIAISKVFTADQV